MDMEVEIGMLFLLFVVYQPLMLKAEINRVFDILRFLYHEKPLIFSALPFGRSSAPIIGQ